MSNDGNYTKKDGEWVQVVERLDGEKEYISIDDEMKAKIEARYGDSSNASVTKGEIKDLLRSAMELGIQKERERSELKNSKDGGGVVTLNGKREILGTGNRYMDIHNELDRLHKEESLGSIKAKRELDQLFELMGREIMQMTGEGIVMVQCPKCSKPITTSETSVCQFCGFDLAGESGYSRYGEIFGGKRRV